MNKTTIDAIVRGDREVFPPYLYEAYQSTRRRAPALAVKTGAIHCASSALASRSDQWGIGR